MTEIERIIETWWFEDFGEKKEDRHRLAKAIGQYVIKARIEELDIIRRFGMICSATLNYVNERITQLKKSLTQKE